MRVFLQTEELDRSLGRLGPYLAASLENAALLARRLHAEEVTLEHLLCTLLEDEESALTQLVLFAFADPETIGQEILALAPGILVVASERCMPFSVLAVGALEAARDSAREHGHAAVSPAHIALASFDALDDEVRGDCVAADWNGARALDGTDLKKGAYPPSGGLFRHFTKEARRALAQSARVARKLGRDAISPAHLLLAVLAEDSGLAERTGFSASRAGHLFAGRDEDRTPPPERALAPDAALVELLAGLPEGADTEDLLAWIHREGPEELRGLFARQKVGPELLVRADGAFRDPSL